MMAHRRAANGITTRKTAWVGVTKSRFRRDQPADDPITQEVIATVEARFDNPGDLSQFRLAVTADAAKARFDWFVTHALADFGTYQDALVEESPWVFHSLISMYINAERIEPLEVCERVEKAWRDGECSLSAAGLYQTSSWVARVYSRYLLALCPSTKPAIASMLSASYRRGFGTAIPTCGV